MGRLQQVGSILGMAALLAGCGEGSGAANDQASDVRTIMQQQVNPATLAIWEVGNNAMNDVGGIDPAKMDAAKWTALAERAETLAAAGRAMAAKNAPQASAPDNTTVAEGETSMADVQRALDADPAGFHQLGGAFAEHATRLAAAAKARDAAAAGDLVAGLDAVCESCHAKYWYPETP